MITNIKEFHKFYIQQECSEVELNEMLLDMYVDKKISKQVFIEYLEITQADVDTCLQDYMEGGEEEYMFATQNLTIIHNP
jgi:hypothetical protein